MRRITSEARSLLRRHLGADSRALPFAEAVLLQVSHPLGAEAPHAAQQAEVAARVADLLSASRAGGEAAQRAAPSLASSPTLLAAFFQNVDLLYERGYEHADAVSLLVMAALADAEPTG